MRTRIKVMDLTLRQWYHVHNNTPTSYDIPDGAVRVCVEFELAADLDAHHVEMPVRAFVALMTQLQRIENTAETVQVGVATFTPGTLPGHLEDQRNAADPARAAERLPVLPTADEVRGLSAAEAVDLAARMNRRTCDHGAAVVEEVPSAFHGAEPVRKYADGCSSVGPYRNES